MWNEYLGSIFIDLFSVFCCVGLLIRFSRLRFSHPGVPYLFFHIHTVTVRLFGLANGAPALFSGTFFWGVEPSEIIRAAGFLDLALWTVTVVWCLFPCEDPRAQTDESAQLIDPRLLRWVVILTVGLGTFGLRYLYLPGYDPGLGNTEWGSSSYLLILPAWFGLGLLIHIYYHGANRITGALMGVYLILIMLQGQFRFRVITASLMLVFVWVERRNRRWPSLWGLAALAILAVLFFPMKEIGFRLMGGRSLDEVSTTVADSMTDLSNGRAADQGFLDQAASAMTLSDLRGEKLWFASYVPLITLPIPRLWWPDKPSLAEASAIDFVSRASRPMNQCRMIPTYVGEAYIDFGILGVFIVPLLLALALAAISRRASRAPYDSVRRFTYAMISVNLIQVYRDGLGAIFMFTLVNMMPLALLVAAHLALRLFQERTSRREVRAILGGQTGLALPSSDIRPS